MHITIHDPATDSVESHRCWETAIPTVYQTIVGDRIINIHLGAPMNSTTYDWVEPQYPPLHRPRTIKELALVMFGRSKVRSKVKSTPCPA